MGFWLTALVCLTLLTAFAAVQVAHLHTSESDADHCALCIVMHSAAPVLAIAGLVILVRFERFTPPVEARVVVRRRVSRPVTRPPPDRFQAAAVR